MIAAYIQDCILDSAQLDELTDLTTVPYLQPPLKTRHMYSVRNKTLVMLEWISANSKEKFNVIFQVAPARL